MGNILDELNQDTINGKYILPFVMILLGLILTVSTSSSFANSTNTIDKIVNGSLLLASIGLFTYGCIRIYQSLTKKKGYQKYNRQYQKHYRP